MYSLGGIRFGIGIGSMIYTVGLYSGFMMTECGVLNWVPGRSRSHQENWSLVRCLWKGKALSKGLSRLCARDFYVFA